MSIIVIENPFKTGSHINPINLSSFPDLPPIFRFPLFPPFPRPAHREVPVSITQEEIVHVPRVVYQHRHHHAEVEQVVDLHVPHHIEETVSVPKVGALFEDFWGWGMDWIRYLFRDFDDDFYLSTAILINNH